MSQDTLVVDAQPQDGDVDSSPEDTQGQAPDSTPQDGDENEKVKRANAEAAKYRREVRELQEALRKREEADLSELEKANKRAQEAEARAEAAEQRARERLLEVAVTQAATKLKFRDPEDALSMIRTRVELDDDGQPQNVEPLLKDLLKEKPYLASATEGLDGSGGRKADRDDSDVTPGIGRIRRAYAETAGAR